jgi:hypothetical protein
VECWWNDNVLNAGKCEVREKETFPSAILTILERRKIMVANLKMTSVFFTTLLYQNTRRQMSGEHIVFISANSTVSDDDDDDDDNNNETCLSYVFRPL